MAIEKYLHEFKENAKEWFEQQEWFESRYSFFRKFFERKNLEKAGWDDFQKMGDQIHSFNALAIAKKNALGNMNHPIEHYRKSFLYLIYGEDANELRIERFFSHPDYSLKYFGESASSELLGYAFADKYVLYNRRDKFGLDLLNIDPRFERGDAFSRRYIKFNKAIEPLIQSYKKIVGQQTSVPINLEIDQFFSYLYEKYHKVEKKQYGISKEQKKNYWNVFINWPLIS